MPQPIRDRAAEMLASPDLIDLIKKDIRTLGVIGDTNVAMAVYVCGTSRLLDKPVSARVRGGTGSGKSFTITAVAGLFPAEAKVEAHHLSPKALYYLPDDALMHKFVIGGERSRRQDDEQADATKALREMISDGVLRAAVTEQIDGRLQTIQYEKKGPIAFVESTSAAFVFAEDENRCLVLNVDESEEQTKKIVAAAGAAAAEIDKDTGEIVQIHHAMQRMLKPVKVKIAFAPMLAEAFPTTK